MDADERGIIEIAATPGIDQSGISSLLAQHFAVKRGGIFFVRAAVGPTELPPLIQLVGTVAAFAPLSVAATAFLTRLSEKAADASWKAIERLFSRRHKDEAAIADLASSIVKARNQMGDVGSVFFGLNFPHSHGGTVVIVSSGDARTITEAVVGFVARAEDISRVVEAEVAAGTKPSGHVRVEIDRGRVTEIHWIDQNFTVQVRPLPQQEQQ